MLRIVFFVGPATIYLRKGVFYLDNSVNLGPQDSYLTFSNYNDEEVEINGGKLLAPKWTAYHVSSNPIATISSSLFYDSFAPLTTS